MNVLTPTNPNRRTSASAGFTLVEILIALGIFAIGMVAVVSLFPAAAILQRETNMEVIGDIAAQSAASIIEAKELTFVVGSGDLANYHAAAGANRSDAVPLLTLSGFNPNKLPAVDRSYPLSQVNGTSIADCDLFWVPFIQDLNGDDTGSDQLWVMRIFLLESDSRVTYSNAGPAEYANPTNPTADPANFPRVSSISLNTTTPITSGNIFNLTGVNSTTHGLVASDIIMDSNGNDHIVTNVNGAAVTVLRDIPVLPAAPTKVWYAPKFTGSSSPAMRVVTVEIDVPAP